MRPEVEKVPNMAGEQKGVMASKAGRLLRSVRLLLAREKSYDVTVAERSKRGRRLTKSVSTTRYVQHSFSYKVSQKGNFYHKKDIPNCNII